MNGMRRAAAFGLALLAAVGATIAAEVAGRLSIVTGDVQTRVAEATRSYAARLGAKIALDERVETGERAAAELLLGDRAIVSAGARTSFAVVPASRDGSGESPAATVELVRGVIRVFVSRAEGGAREVRVESSGAAVGIESSEAAVEALEDGTTRLTPLGGSGRVRWRPAATTAWREIARGQQVVVGPGDRVAVAAIDSAAEQEILARTQPVPTIPQARPRARDHRDYGPPG